MNKHLAPKILLLHQEGKTYDEIQNILQCSKGTISYHLGINQKLKSKLRIRANRSTQHPYVRKLENFKQNRLSNNKLLKTHKTHKLLQLKLETFFKDRVNNLMYQRPDYTIKEVIDKLTTNPTCYQVSNP